MGDKEEGAEEGEVRGVELTEEEQIGHHLLRRRSVILKRTLTSVKLTLAPQLRLVMLWTKRPVATAPWALFCLLTESLCSRKPEAKRSALQGYLSAGCPWVFPSLDSSPHRVFVGLNNEKKKKFRVNVVVFLRLV